MEQAVDVQQDHASSPVLEDPADPPHAVPASSRLAGLDHNRTLTVGGQSISEQSPQPENLMVTGDTKSEGSGEDDDSLEDDTSSVGTDVTQLHAPRTNGSDDEVLSRQLNDDTELNQNQPVEGRISYYSYGDFEPRNSGLKEVELGLQAPSKTSRYGSMTDVSRSFLLAASEG